MIFKDKIKNWLILIKCYVKVNINYQRRLESFVAQRLSNIFYNYKFKNKYGIKVVIYLKKHSTIKEILNQKKVERKKEIEVKKE